MKLPDTITEDELVKLVAAAPKKHHRAAFLLGFYEGMRVSEVCNLQFEDVDAARMQIHIRQSKGKKDRIIPLLKAARPAMRHLPIGCGPRALQMAASFYSQRVLGRRIKFHTLRHSGATWLLNVHHKDIRFIQQFLGHSRISTTEIYTHVSPQDLMKSMEDLL
jgi:integrase/recombinase XerD